MDRLADAPTVSAQQEDANSLLNHVRTLTKLRHDNADLQADGEFELLVADKCGRLCYRRGNLAVAINPTDVTQPLQLAMGQKLFEVGSATIQGNATMLAPQTAVVFKLI